MGYISQICVQYGIYYGCRYSGTPDPGHPWLPSCWRNMTFPGKDLFQTRYSRVVFSGYITAIPNYLIINELGWIDTYWAIIIPAFASPMGLFLMKQFMEGLPMSLIEAAKIDGANEWKVFISIVMPNVKPAWLTMIIFSVQGLWNNQAA